MDELSDENEARDAASEDVASGGDDMAAGARRRELKRLKEFVEGTPRLQLREDLRVEEIDQELVVLDAAGEALHRVTGDGVPAVRLLESGVAEAEIPDHLFEAVEALAQAGLVSGRRRLSRRKLIAVGGATWVAATVTTFALADPAAAWSSCRNGKTPTAPDSGSAGKKYTVPGTYNWVSGPSGFHTPNTQQSYNIIVRAWGGGGSGGHDALTLGGGGGGGGAYVDATISVVECTDYTVVVGSGGTGNSVNGADSYFKDTATLKAAGGSRGIDAAFLDSGDGGAGGTVANSAPAGGNRRAGGNGGTGGAFSDTACGGGSGGSTGDGGAGSAGSAGAGGSGTPGGAAGGTENNAGSAPGGGGGGGNSTGGNGGHGAVWVGV